MLRLNYGEPCELAVYLDKDSYAAVGLGDINNATEFHRKKFSAMVVKDSRAD